MDVPHVQPIPIRFGVGVAVEIVNPAIGGLLVLVTDNRLDLPGVWRIGAPLSVIVSGFGDVPEMIDHAGTEKRASLRVPGDSPGITGPFRE